MPEYAAIKKTDDSSMYQNKVKEIFPHTRISAKRVTSLATKLHNEIFQMTMTVRVAGIEDEDTGGGEIEPIYDLEIREASVKRKVPEEMTAEEIQKKIEEEQTP